MRLVLDTSVNLDGKEQAEFNIQSKDSNQRELLLNGTKLPISLQELLSQKAIKK